MGKGERKPCPGYRCQALAPTGARWCPSCWRRISELTRVRLGRCFDALDRGDRTAAEATRIALRDADREIAASRSSVEVGAGAR